MHFFIALCVFVALVSTPKLLAGIIHHDRDVPAWIIVLWALAVTMIVTFKVF
jgi:hypothetical protein